MHVEISFWCNLVTQSVKHTRGAGESAHSWLCGLKQCSPASLGSLGLGSWGLAVVSMGLLWAICTAKTDAYTYVFLSAHSWLCGLKRCHSSSLDLKNKLQKKQAQWAGLHFSLAKKNHWKITKGKRTCCFSPPGGGVWIPYIDPANLGI